MLEVSWNLEEIVPDNVKTTKVAIQWMNQQALVVKEIFSGIL